MSVNPRPIRRPIRTDDGYRPMYEAGPGWRVLDWVLDPIANIVYFAVSRLWEFFSWGWHGPASDCRSAKRDAPREAALASRRSSARE